MKAPPVSADALSTDLRSSNPRVVVGVPPSDPPPAGSSESTAPVSVETKGTVDGVVPSLSARSGGIDPLEALETLEKASLPPPSGSREALPPEAPSAERGEVSAAADDGTAGDDENDNEDANDEDDEGTQTQGSLGSTIAFGSMRDGEPAVSQKSDEGKPVETKRSLAQTMAFGSSANVALARSDAHTDRTNETNEPSTPTVAAPPLEPQPALVETAAEKVVARVEEETRTEETRATEDKPSPAVTAGKKNKKNKAAKAERARAAAAAAGDATDPDEISVPPIGDVGVDEQFFSQGDVSRHFDGDALEHDPLTIPDKAKRKAEPHVVERRTRFVRYVKWAVAGAAVVCLAAVARTSLTSKTPASTARAAVATAPAEAPPAAPKAAVQAAAPITTPAATPEVAAAAAEPAPTAAPVEPAAAATATADHEGKVDAKTEVASEANAEEPTGDAKEEKAKARTFLEKRKIADAIDAGERAVKLDPTDGESWLLLGAAYQEKGNMVEARRAYASCVKEGKTGPRQECAKMLR